MSSAFFARPPIYSSKAQPAPKRNWKVVWWVDLDRGRVRCVLGQREAAQAWKLYWALKGKAHVVGGPELWRGRRRVMGGA